MNVVNLYKKNKQGKILVWSADSRLISPDKNSIVTKYGQLGGKIQTEFTDVVPKANRNPYEQMVLELTSLYNKQRDKGYKSSKDLGIIAIIHEEGDSYYTTNIVEDNRKWYSELDAILALLPDELTDAQGVLKPMKCTALQNNKTSQWLPNVVKKIIFPCYVQPKLDGVRCFISHNGVSWQATSSSGKSYNIAARYILEQIEQFSDRHDIIYDGELYIHNVPLQNISGWCRKQTEIPEHKNLEFHIFDVIEREVDSPFKDRVGFLKTGVNIQDLRPTYYDNLVFVDTLETKDINRIKELNSIFISQGYEGTIIRNAELGYEFGRRSSSIFKLKDFRDEEFEIVGVELGKRGSEDMVFVCVTHYGKSFNVNPIGNREQKEYWCNNPESWKGKQGTVRYLTLSNDGIPQGNPVLKAIRDYEN